MSEEQAADTSQAGAGFPGEQVEEQVQETEQKSENTESKTYDEAYVKQLRDEAAKHRTELRKLQKERKERDDAEKSDLEKTNAELEELRQERETWRRERLAGAFRSQVGLPSPGLALGAARELGLDIELDDAGNVKDLAAIQKRLKTEYPREFGDGSADGAETGTRKGSSPKTMNDMIRAATGR